MKKIIINIIIMMAFLFSSANALEIVSPQNITYNTTGLLFSLTSNQTLDNISFTLDDNLATLACANCSEYTANLVLLEGDHIITANSVLGNDTFNDSVEFSIEIPVVTAPNLSVNIISPENKIYNTTEIFFNTATNLAVDELQYQIDNTTSVLVCENCTNYNETLNLSEGNHSITVAGKIGNITVSQQVIFTVEITEEVPTPQQNFSLEIIEPEDKIYNASFIPVLVDANVTLDSLFMKLDNDFDVVCENCSSYNETLNLSNGNYTVFFKGIYQNSTQEENVSFIVEVPKSNETPEINETPDEKDNETEPRFSIGFEKLPKTVENNELTDSQLAQIIRENKLNPGVLNRLIKTGKLGEESIDAILDTQSQSVGIFRKLMLFIGLRQDTISSQIYESYNLSQENEDKLLTRDDVPRGIKKQIKEKNTRKATPVSQGNKKIGNEENSSNSVVINKIPPGLQNKSGKIPPGQLKKNNN